MAGETITVLAAVEAGLGRDVVDDALPASSRIHVTAVVEGLGETLDVLHRTPVDVLVIACSGQSDKALALIETATREAPDRPVVVLGRDPTDSFLRRALEAGADDVVALPAYAGDVRLSIEKALVRRERAAAVPGATERASLICILGPKGGTGKTVTAANLATALAVAGRRVMLVDLDLQFGDVGLALGLSPERTLADLARAGGGLDAEKVDEFAAEHSSGARVLLAPTRPDQASLVTVEFLRDLYRAVRESYEFVVVDTPPAFTAEVIATVDEASHVCMVAMLDTLSLKNTKLGLETLDLMGFGSERIALVLNRADSRVGLQRDDVQTVLGRMPDVFVPSHRDIARSVNEATPIVLHERGESANAFRALSRIYLGGSPNGHAQNGTSSTRQRLLPTLRGRR
jgi:pilus assembly protein CpaE